jgi:hypothetical protein
VVHLLRTTRTCPYGVQDCAYDASNVKVKVRFLVGVPFNAIAEGCGFLPAKEEYEVRLLAVAPCSRSPMAEANGLNPES